jgi:hypothetical protein
MQVKDIMTINVISIGADQPVAKDRRFDAPESHQRSASRR